MTGLNTVKTWVGGLTEVALMLLALRKSQTRFSQILRDASPLSGLLLAALLLGERLTWPLAVGAAVVITGVAIARRP